MSSFKVIQDLIKNKLKNSRTLSSALTYGTASVFTQSLMMIYLIIVAQWLGAEQYAYIAAAHAATALSAFLFSWGFNEWLMKAGATSEDIERLGGSVLNIKLLLGIGWGIGLWALLRLIRPELYLSEVIILSVVEVWFDSTFGTLLALLILKSRAKLASILLSLSRLFRLLVVVGFILVGPKSVTWVLLLRLITTLAFFLITWSFVKPKLQGDQLIRPRELFKSSSAFNLSELLNLIFLHADVNILSWLGADLTLIANYSIVISLINAVITLPSGIYNVFLPNLVRTFEGLKSHFYRNIRWLYSGFVLLGIVLWIGVTSLSQPIITAVFGETYLASIQILIWIAPLIAVRTINQANIAYLVAVGWQRRRLVPQLISVIVKLIAGVTAISIFHDLSIIVVSIGTEGLLFFLYIIQVFRHTKIPRMMEKHEYFNDHL